MTQNDVPTMLEKSAPLLDHLEELRTRLIYSLIYLVIGLGAAWNFVPRIIKLLQEPLEHTALYKAGKLQLVATQLPEQLLMSFNIALWAGLAIALPFILHQIWLFIAPGLYQEEKRWAAPFIVGAGVSFMLGVVTAYYLILPPMVKFLADFLGGTVSAFLSVGTYIGQVVTVMVAFGLFFEMPILAVVLTKIGVVNHVMLGSVRKFAFIACLVAAAIITPTTDPVNMALFAGPLYLLYEVGVLLSRVFRKREEAEVQSGDPFAGI
ncbi:twin-arginine translocase subunit TatC [Deinococcus aquiradiocola]|uniref:Sec-independent protein translocase protein TatC n=1 Tax=Deinococcus aquiradiocola TaxID=393059 RepID=A0A917ULB7_9DEIO|nr:twin-arginine translocase subunit TatC [Deinococcus aquiradiocola]GGJ66146.1 Sec-independent protein translocase protein TatC [Deinococcus aquiradiocola]